ncbi:MAG: cation diffusion facilitator family transporter [Thaumarchaeota archaeon]|nr:cation diffusion facilitator family transporter [Nitrososphaerota archaeon]
MEPRRALFVALSLSITILAVELTGGFLFRSTALTADALHVVTDILAVAFSLVALTVSSRPPTNSLTYGYHRFEVVASLVNGLSLLGIALVIMYGAYLRFISPASIGALGTITFAAVAVVLNVLSSRVLESAQASLRDDQDLNISSAKTHVFGDALASLAVIAGAIGVSLTGLTYLDPLVAVLIGLLVVRSAVGITMQGGAIILERSPFKDVAGLQRRLGSFSGVSDVHDLHIWRICSHITVASMHACLTPSGKADPSAVRNGLESELGRLGMQHVTIQLEDVCCVPKHEHL